MPASFPPGPRPLPIIGNTVFMRTQFSEEMTKLSRRYGPIMGLKLRSFPVVVINGKDLIKEGLHHSSLQYRPRFMYAVNEFCPVEGLYED